MQQRYLESVLQSLDSIKALDVKVIEVSQQTSVTDYMVVCTGRSDRHVKAIAETVIETMKKRNFPALSCSGMLKSDWVLVDFSYVILNVMQAESRSFYNIEGLWHAA